MSSNHGTNRDALFEPSTSASSTSSASSNLSNLEKQALQDYGSAYLDGIYDIQELVQVHLRSDVGHFHTFLPPSGGDSTHDLRASHGKKKRLDSALCFSHKIASNEDLKALTTSHPLSPLTGAKWRKDVQFIYWSTYSRIWALAVVINISTISAMIWGPHRSPEGLTYHQASLGVASNFIVAALARQEHVVNFLFYIAECMLPRWTPLCIRKQVAQVYTYGGLHSGCGISAFFWYICFIITLVKQFHGTYAESAALGPMTAIIIAILLVVLCTSHPVIRKRWHNYWQLSHRYGGWAAITLSWAQTLIMCIAQANNDNVSVGITVIEAPTFWVLSIISCCLIYPWIRLRRRKVEPERLSNHAVRLWFKNQKKVPTCVGQTLSTFPLAENCGFSTIPNKHGQQGYSVVVSTANDWSRKVVESPPTRIWTRGALTKGVLRIATLFRPIVVVATDAGIATCLSFLQVYPNYPMRILWSARSPELTYGCRILSAVLQADREAVIIDTKKTGHPDLVSLTFALHQGIGAEAVVVISDATVTRQLSYEMEMRKIAAFGPIFDS